MLIAECLSVGRVPEKLTAIEVALSAKVVAADLAILIAQPAGKPPGCTDVTVAGLVW